MKKDQPHHRTSLLNPEAKIQNNFIICFDRDIGITIHEEASIPVEKVPYGLHVLPFIGTEKEARRLIKRYQKNPYLLEKYAIL